MKPIFAILFLFPFLKTVAQGDSQNLYFNFLQPSIYNPAFQEKKPVTSVVSIFNWRPVKNKGYLNLKGGVNIVLEKQKINLGTNYSSFQHHKNPEDGYHAQPAWFYFNRLVRA